MKIGQLLVAIALVVGLGMDRAAHADLILDFSPDGSVTSFAVNPGGTVEVPIFLRQVGAGPFAPDITSDGLLGFGFQVDLTSTPGSATATGFSISSPFIDLAGISTLGASSLQLFGDNFAGVTGSAVELARITILGNVAGNTTNITLSDPNPAPLVQDFGTLGSSDLDSQIFSTPATISVTTVPEPGSTLLLVAFSIASFARRRTR